MTFDALERVVFEEIENCYERYNEYAELAKVAEYGAEYNGESAEEIVRYGHLANEQIFNSDYLKELISKAGMQEKYQAWLKERREREQPEEDAEEPAEENIFELLEEEPVKDITLDINSLTPLEIAFFEQVYGNECDLEDETIDHEFDAYLSEFVYGEIMKKSKSFDMYLLWRDEHKKQEMVAKK